MVTVAIIRSHEKRAKDMNPLELLQRVETMKLCLIYIFRQLTNTLLALKPNFLNAQQFRTTR